MSPSVDDWYYVGSIIARRRRGQFSVLIMKTVKRRGNEAGRELWQFPGGMEELSDNGNPFKTLDRELGQETGFQLRENLENDPPIFHEEIKDGHLRYFYALWRNDLRGSLRTTVVDDVAKTLHVPVWESIQFINEHLCDSQRKAWRAFKKKFVYNKGPRV